MRADPEQRRRASWHESGHLLAYHLHGWPITSVAIAEDGSGMFCGVAPSGPSAAFDLAVCILAGPAGEYVATGASVSIVNGGHDLEEARMELGDDFAVQAAARRAIALMREHRELLELLAGELERRGHLSAEDIDRLLSG